MTNEYKINLIDWLNGNLDLETNPNNFDTFQNMRELTKEDIVNPDGNGGTVVNAVQITSPNGSNSTWLVLLLWDSSTQKGKFILLNENLDKVATIDEYESGEDIGRFSNLYVDEEGRIYGIECRPTEQRYRFVILSNFLVAINGEYKCDIRKAYNLPNAWTNTDSDTRYDNKNIIKKIPNTPKYAFWIYNDSSRKGELGTIEINVEQGNTIKEQVISSLFSETAFNPLIEYDNNNLFTFTYKSLALQDETDIENYLSWTYTERTEISNNAWFATNGYTVYLDYAINVSMSNIYWFSKTEYLIVGRDNTANDLIKFHKITENQVGENIIGTNTVIKQEAGFTSSLQVIFTETNGYLYCYIRGWNPHIFAPEFPEGFKEMIYHITNKTNTMSASDFHEYVMNYSETQPLVQIMSSFFLVQNIYNLYKCISGVKRRDTDLNKWVFDINCVSEIYNENNYNGTAYTNLESLIGNQGILYDHYGAIFARNLYNKVIQNNKTTYSLEIPNNMLNDITITREDLISELKNSMNMELKDLSKNRYEELIINFINTISIVNNINDTPVSNKIGATRLNNSISEEKDYDDSKMTKYRVNYSDNTTYVGILGSEKTDIKKYGLSLFVSVEKAITSIDFISEDENTIYNTITPTLQVGKAYMLSVDVYIE